MGEIRTEPGEITIGSSFKAIVPLYGDTCGLEAKFFLDGNLTGSKSVGCDVDMLESPIVDLSRKTLDCKKHILQVVFFRSGTFVANASREIDIGKNPDVSYTFDESGTGNLVIHFRDPDTGAPLKALNVEVYNVRKGPSLYQTYSTNAAGDLEIRSSEQGAYVMTIDDSNYCGRFVYYVKKFLQLDGPYPEHPRVGDVVSVTAPPGVGMKVLDSSGKLYANLNASFAGSANFTLDEPGNYTLVVGETSMDYFPKNITICVSDKPEAKIVLKPAEGIIRGREILISASDEKGPLAGVSAIIQTPDAKTEELQTAENGTLSYTPQSTGRHIIRLSDADHKPCEASFSVTDALNIDYAPRQPVTGQEINVYVRNQEKNLIVGATVSVPGVIHGLTGPDGRFTFSVDKPGRYAIEASGPNSISAAVNITVTSPINLRLEPPETELGGNITITAYDSAGTPLDALIEVFGPGASLKLSGHTYTPAEAGKYGVRASKEGYIPSEANFTVLPHPLDEPAVELKGDVLIINVSSRNKPVEGIHVTITGAGGKQVVVTSQNGSAQTTIISDGRVRIIANMGRTNPNYSEAEVSYTIQKKKPPKTQISPSIYLLAFAAIAIIASIGLLAYSRRKMPQTGTKRYGLSGGRPANISRRKQ